MPEIRILTEIGQSIEIKADQLPPGKSVKDLADDIFHNGFRLPVDGGERIIRVVAVDYTEGTFSGIVVPRK